MQKALNPAAIARRQPGDYLADISVRGARRATR